MHLNRLPEMVDTFRVMIRHRPDEQTFKTLARDVARYMATEATVMDIAGILLTSCEMFREADRDKNFTEFCMIAIRAEPRLVTKVKQNRKTLEMISQISDG